MGRRLNRGVVVSIRVNPLDCLSVIDLLEQHDMIIRGQSFASMVSLAFSSMLAGLRKNGVVPTRDGFEFNDMMNRYATSSRDSRKLEVTNTLKSVSSDFVIKPVGVWGADREEAGHTPFSRSRQYGEIQREGDDGLMFQNGAELRKMTEEEALQQSRELDKHAVLSTEDRLNRRRLAELVTKKDISEQENSGVVFSSADQREFDKLSRLVYGN